VREEVVGGGFGGEGGIGTDTVGFCSGSWYFKRYFNL
jgi:hypothetical protein